ncbi:MAG: SpoVA/SpoVAEb family sporulation membrane protein [Bacilli bacterium]
MIFLKAFLFCGVVCLIGQLLLSYTKLTPGHINTIFVIVGSFLSSVGVYEKFITWAGAGASVPITNFGHLLVSGALKGYEAQGYIGFIKGFLSNASGGLVITIISAFLVALVFKPRN